jgi:hypothetical protein
MKATTVLVLAASGFLAVGCGNASPTTSVTDPQAVSASVSGPKGGHFVSVGSNDACEAYGAPRGCDANFSLVAIQTADGAVSGQWQDEFAGGKQGVHVSIDCLNVVGNGAVVGGVVTRGWSGDEDLTGQRALAAVMDNGTSANDPPDQITPSFTDTQHPCTDYTPEDFASFGYLFDLTTGQVTVR